MVFVLSHEQQKIKTQYNKGNIVKMEPPGTECLCSGVGTVLYYIYKLFLNFLNIRLSEAWRGGIQLVNLANNTVLSHWGLPFLNLLEVMAQV